MRIRCTGCGREYRVSEERLAGGAIRAKCRSCGRMLHIRMRPTNPAEPAEGASVPGAKGLEPDGKEPIGLGGYRYCIACGAILDLPVPATGRPVCAACESAKAARRRGLSAGVAADLAAAGRRARLFFYVAIVLAVLVSAYFGYRLAAGSTAAVVVGGAGGPARAPDLADRAG